MIDHDGSLDTHCREIVGLIPAAGHATRVAPLPCSKELYPVGFSHAGSDGIARPKVVCQFLLDRMRLAGVSKAYIVLRHGKWDIPGYFGDGSMVGMNLGYLMQRLPYGVPWTLDQARPFLGNATVVMGYPDILFEPEDALAQLLAQQAITGAELVLGLFPTDRPQVSHMVRLDDRGRVREIVIKPGRSELTRTWICAVWTPVFGDFMHEYVVGLTGTEMACGTGRTGPGHAEVTVSHVIQSAIEAGMRVEGVVFPAGSYLDIGMPDNLRAAVRLGVMSECGTAEEATSWGEGA